MFEAFRIPVPGNTAASLGRLVTKELVVRRTKPPPWSLTPLGRKTVLELLGEIDPAKLEAQLLDLPGAELADTHQTILPQALRRRSGRAESRSCSTASRLRRTSCA
jgi:hypothetical protein